MNDASGRDEIAVVTNTWSPHTTGLEWASPGRKLAIVTNKPIGMNFTLMQGVKIYEQRTREWMDIAIEEGIKRAKAA